MPGDKKTESFVLSFKKGVTLLEQSDGSMAVRSCDTEILLKRPSSALREVLRVLSSDGATEEQLLDLVSRHCSGAEVLGAAYYLRHFTQQGMLCHTIRWNGSELASLVPFEATDQEIPDEPAAEARYVISRYLHTDGGRFVLESPLAGAKIVIHDSRVMTLLNTLVRACTLEELYSASQNISRGSAALLVRLLLKCHALSRISEGGQVEEETPTLAQWEFHDLLFHTRSRLGRHDNPYGATLRFRGRIDSLSAVKASASDEAVRLYKPDIQALSEIDIPFTRVLEERRSIRKHAEHPITVEQLGEFLYRTARLRVLFEATEEGYERSDRPYPSGGACYELEVYLVINVCGGLSSGLYHYCPETHRLDKMADRTREVEALVEGAYYAADQQGVPQVLIILAARFPRVAWKYDAMAYALILKHVGVLYQTMYLVATAMGLAPCALGGGNSDIFATGAGTDYYAETSVGEFILGSKAT
jgi:SagB-type dehydrogenase family enzyme